nr:phage holin family protein [Streptomyces sp. NBC_00857]
MLKGRWRTTGRALLRVIIVWVVSALTMLLLAGILPDFQFRSGDGESITRTAVTAGWGAGAFGLLSALVWPLLVRAVLLVPALVLGLLVFFLNGSLLLIALRLIPDGRGVANPETAVVVAAVMSAVASATSTALAVGDDAAYGRRFSRLAGRRRRGSGEDAGHGGLPGTVFLQLDGVGHQVLLDAVADGVMPHVTDWLGEWPTHRLTPWRTDWSSQTGASQLGILHGSNHDVPAFRWYEKDTGRIMVSNRPAGAVELQRRAIERTGDGGLLTLDGASRGNLFSGGADQLALVLSMAAMGPGAADAVRRTDAFPHVADIMVNSMYDPATGRVHAFEEQIGSHGGLGGEQSRAFLLSPLVLSASVPGGGELVGAERVHGVLRRWLREGCGPQVPLGRGGRTTAEQRTAEGARSEQDTYAAEGARSEQGTYAAEGARSEQGTYAAEGVRTAGRTAEGTCSVEGARTAEGETNSA